MKNGRNDIRQNFRPVPPGRPFFDVSDFDKRLPSHRNEFESRGPVVGMLIRFDSLFVVKRNSAEAEEPVSNAFNTNVRFDRNPPEATDCKSGKEIVQHAIEMLDNTLTLQQGWMRYGTENLIHANNELISALKVVERLFQYVLKQIETENCAKIVMAVPTEFTENQREGLLKVAKSICSNVVLLSEAEAVALGVAQQNKVTKSHLFLTVDLSMTGCTCTLTQLVNSANITRLAEKSDDTLFSENVRQNQRAWFNRTKKEAYPPTDTPDQEILVKRLQNSSYTVNSVKETALNQLRQLIDSVVQGSNHFEVKTVLLLGKCREIPLLNNLLYWKFSDAQVMTLSATDFHKFITQGISCSQANIVMNQYKY